MQARTRRGRLASRGSLPTRSKSGGQSPQRGRRRFAVVLPPRPTRSATLPDLEPMRTVLDLVQNDRFLRQRGGVVRRTLYPRALGEARRVRW